MVLEIITALVLAWLLYFLLSSYASRKSLPAGPFPLPMIGNLHQVGLDIPFSLEKLREKYGDMYTVTLPIGNFVILNSSKLMREALVSRKDDFSGRTGVSNFPFNRIFEGKDVGFTDYGPEYTFRRKVFSSAMHIFGEGKNLAKRRLNKSTKELLKLLHETDGRPFSIKDHVETTSVNVLCEWLVNTSYKPGDPALKKLKEFNENFAVLIRPGSVYHFLPFLRFLPTAYMNTLREVLETRDDFFGSFLEHHRRTYKSGVVRDLTDAFLAAFEKESERDGDVIKFLMMNAFFAATDTSSAIVVWFVLHMVLFESAQKKLHEELDRVIGKDRLPQMEDSAHLHYTQAVICEVIRHSHSIALIMRKAVRDTSLQGYCIPKGTTVIFNLWRIHSDANQWKEPELFKPDRFLDVNGEFVGWNSNLDFFPFSLGRRACPGITLGKMQVRDCGDLG